ncbi:hypothetical protein LMG3441_03947 [Achromobacter kerstersii]|uniref:Uncharacterized protein n=1 Tax=Achromobacter kerstersii TaxID=1353890 RepID=A0A6S7AC30_9BURK|nr:hypothetical protein LMG3441_03947 [Achromobacter kerstersii]
MRGARTADAGTAATIAAAGVAATAAAAIAIAAARAARVFIAFLAFEGGGAGGRRGPAFHGLALDRLLDQAFDVLQQLDFAVVDQRDRGAGGACAARAADAVHVVFRHVGQFEVHHLRQLVDVQATGGDVGRDQHRHGAVLEAGQRTGAGGLALVAVDRGGGQAVLDQLFSQAVRAVLRAREDQHLMPAAFTDDVADQVALVVLFDQVNCLRDEFRGGVARGDRDFARVVQDAARQRADFVRERGREQQVLALLGQQRENLADVADEAHVQHAVGFVQHQDFHARQVNRLLAAVVQQTAGGGHQDVQRLAQRGDLGVDVDAAEHHHGRQRGVLAVGLHRFRHLRGQFTRRGQDQATGAAGLAAFRLLLRQQMQNGQREAGGFASAGLCGGQQVAAFQHLRNGLGLNGGGRGVAGFGNGAQQGISQPEVGKRGRGSQNNSSGSPSLKLRDSNPGGRIRRKGKRPDGRSLAAKGLADVCRLAKHTAGL